EAYIISLRPITGECCMGPFVTLDMMPRAMSYNHIPCAASPLTELSPTTVFPSGDSWKLRNLPIAPSSSPNLRPDRSYQTNSPRRSLTPQTNVTVSEAEQADKCRAG